MADAVAPSTSTGPGGFIVPTLPSPAPSTTSNAPSSLSSSTALPHPRGQPLRPGSAKAEKLRTYAETRLMHINRRYVKKFGLREPGDEVVGYASLRELVQDVEALINILWLSGTPSLQIPHLLNIASEATTWLASFPTAAEPMFSLLGKLDHCFASLLAGQDISTRETLPGFENGLRGGMTRTDMVRCRSLVEQTRVLVVAVLERDTEGEDTGLSTDDDRDGSATDGEDGEDEEDGGRDERGVWTDDEARLRMDAARVYEHSIVRLGELLEQGGGVPAEVHRSED